MFIGLSENGVVIDAEISQATVEQHSTHISILRCIYLHVSTVCMPVKLTVMFAVILHRQPSWIFHRNKGIASYLSSRMFTGLMENSLVMDAEISQNTVEQYPTVTAYKLRKSEEWF